jgi:hypothetical protein
MSPLSACSVAGSARRLRICPTFRPWSLSAAGSSRRNSSPARWPALPRWYVAGQRRAAACAGLLAGRLTDPRIGGGNDWIRASPGGDGVHRRLLDRCLKPSRSPGIHRLPAGKPPHVPDREPRRGGHSRVELRAAQEVLARCPQTTFVLKDGPGPTRVLQHRVPVLTVPVPPVSDIKDSTGAGDAFAAGPRPTKPLPKPTSSATTPRRSCWTTSSARPTARASRSTSTCTSTTSPSAPTSPRQSPMPEPQQPTARGGASRRRRGRIPSPTKSPSRAGNVTRRLNSPVHRPLAFRRRRVRLAAPPPPGKAGRASALPPPRECRKRDAQESRTRSAP